MADKTGISWTDATWNPVRGCSRVSEGCRHCYAERVAARFSGPGQPYEGLARRKLTIVNNEEPDPGNRIEARWTGEVRFVTEHLADPLRWKKPRRIFVNSMSDLFHEKLTNEQIAAVFGVMAACPQHTFQILTKRAKRMREWFEWAGTLTLDHIQQAAVVAMKWANDAARVSRGTTWPLRNVWLGVSVENQEAADERIPELLGTRAAVRFLSCEPLLGPVELPRHDQSMGRSHSPLSWVIAGCESGPGARTCDVEWLRSLRDQCAAAGVPYFLKQASASHDGARPDVIDVAQLVLTNGSGSKRKAGGVIELPYLDGVQHAQFPEVAS